MHGRSGCFGCCTKSTPVIAVDEPTKGLKIQGRLIEKAGASDDLCSTSTNEMVNSGLQSIRSISSISTSAQPQDHHGMASTSNHLEFVNHGKSNYGLLLWNQTRQKWTGNRKPDNKSEKVHESTLSWNATYDNLLLTNKPFQKPVPLSEMINFLVGVWEQEGLYD